MGRTAKNKILLTSVSCLFKTANKETKKTRHSELEKGKLSAQLGKASIKEEAIK